MRSLAQQGSPQMPPGQGAATSDVASQSATLLYCRLRCWVNVQYIHLRGSMYAMPRQHNQTLTTTLQCGICFSCLTKQHCTALT